MTERNTPLAKSTADIAFALGCHLQENGDLEGARHQFELAALQGCTSAQVNLGNLLDDHLIPRDREKSIYWYKKAVEGGDMNGAWNLHRHYLRERNFRWSKYWLRVAARMGEEDAIELLRTEANRNGDIE